MNHEPLTQERLDAIQARVEADSAECETQERCPECDSPLGEAWEDLRDQAPQDLADLLAEVERLRHFESIVSWRYGDTTDGRTREDMVERGAEAYFLREFLRRSQWADEARARVSLEAERNTGNAWQHRCEDMRAALDAALGTGEGA